MNFKIFFKQYFPSIIITVVILYLCFAPPSAFQGVSKFPKNTDKLVHLLMFAVLTMALHFDFEKQLVSLSKSKWKVCLLFPAALGLLIEICQRFIFTYRSGDWKDWLCDLAGIFVVYVVVKVVKQLRIKN
ncbi:MAG: VanZ family protein [Prevotellaceae bacterium]|jgi:VanZ family protein|nr:VanZ family protein [Prevotellaceae bacterium]